jgi:formylmethanofuran dehydrogenase subunit E
MNIPDNYSQWEANEWRQEKWLKLRPKCARCHKHIQDEDCYEFDGNLICPDCIEEYIDEHYKRKTEDFIN